MTRAGQGSGESAGAASAADLKRVRAATAEFLRDELPEVNRLLEEAGVFRGKGIRAALLLTLARLLRVVGPGRAVRLGAVVEIFHLATLFHDDVLDEAPLRRGLPSLRQRRGNRLAILTGDRLLLAGLGVLTDCGKRWLVTAEHYLHETLRGEILQGMHAGDPDLPRETALDIARRKTGSLFALAAVFAGGCRDDTRERLAEFGYLLGTAFQIADDCLDCSGKTGAAGDKEPFADLRTGVVSLPMIVLREHIGSARSAEIIRTGDTSELAALMREHRVPETCREAARDRAAAALGVLEPLVGEPGLAPLREFADRAWGRTE